MFASWWAALIFGITSEQYKFSKRITESIPTVLFITTLSLLIFYLFTEFLKYRLNRNKKVLGKDETEVLKSYEKAMSFGAKKMKTFFACWGSLVGFIMISAILLILLGFEKYLGAFGFLYSWESQFGFYLPGVFSIKLLIK